MGAQASASACVDRFLDPRLYGVVPSLQQLRTLLSQWSLRDIQAAHDRLRQCGSPDGVVGWVEFLAVFESAAQARVGAPPPQPTPFRC